MTHARLTKQGVRDLGGNSRRPLIIKHELPPACKKAFCNHPLAARAESDYRAKCLDCGASWTIWEEHDPYNYSY